ncbi:hypothetical protein BDY24DRAFT_173612 [Mrakia frigida]|uniref:uncharacterized protein n=1 Tax=Mrakia frigida TaxID=29902 RepID=UPI003FCC24C3
MKYSQAGWREVSSTVRPLGNEFQTSPTLISTYLFDAVFNSPSVQPSLFALPSLPFPTSTQTDIKSMQRYLVKLKVGRRRKVQGWKKGMRLGRIERWKNEQSGILKRRESKAKRTEARNQDVERNTRDAQKKMGERRNTTKGELKRERNGRKASQSWGGEERERRSKRVVEGPRKERR